MIAILCFGLLDLCSEPDCPFYLFNLDLEFWIRGFHSQLSILEFHP